MAGSALALAVVVLGAASVTIRSTRDATYGFGASDFLVVALIAVPSLTLIPASLRWRTWPWFCLSAVGGWLPMVGKAGDLSCTDCAFALFIPMTAALFQVGLWLVVLGSKPRPSD